MPQTKGTLLKWVIFPHQPGKSTAESQNPPVASGKLGEGENISKILVDTLEIRNQLPLNLWRSDLLKIIFEWKCNFIYFLSKDIRLYPDHIIQVFLEAIKTRNSFIKNKNRDVFSGCFQISPFHTLLGFHNSNSFDSPRNNVQLQPNHGNQTHHKLGS